MQAPSTADCNLDITMKLDSGGEHEQRLSPVFELKKEPAITTDPMNVPSPGEHFAHFEFPTIKKERGPVESEPCALTSNHWVPGNYYTTGSVPVRTAGMIIPEQHNTQNFTINTDMPTVIPPNSPLTMVQAHGLTGLAIYPKTGRRKPRNTLNTKRRQWDSDERKKLEQLIEQRSKEWREKQALWRSCQRQYSATNSRYTRPQTPVEHMAYNYNTNHYPMSNEEIYFDQFEGHTQQGVSMASVEPLRLVTQSAPATKMISTPQQIDKQLVIKDVVSLAEEDEETKNTETPSTTGKRRCKRPRKIYEEPDSTETETSDNDDNVKPGKYISDLARPFVNIPDDHQVAHINGLLSLPSNRETRYGITYGELKRRCNTPESLTRVDLVAYVRHSKSSGRSLLDKYRIVSASRNSRPTILSKMCENEARILGDGILKMNSDFFPSKVLAGTASQNVKDDIKADLSERSGPDEGFQIKSAVKDKLQHIEITRSMLKEIYDLLLSEKDSEEMKVFELASHTFGTTNLMNHLTLFDRFFEEYQVSLSSKKK